MDNFCMIYLISSLFSFLYSTFLFCHFYFHCNFNNTIIKFPFQAHNNANKQNQFPVNLYVQYTPIKHHSPTKSYGKQQTSSLYNHYSPL